MSEWADLNRYLPKGSSSKPGKWVTRAFQREMMDAVLEPGVRRVVYLCCTQVVKSEAINNIAGYFIDAEPKAIMIVRETDREAVGYSKKRIAPMIEACPSLAMKVRPAISRASGNTMTLKEFPGGFLKLAGANAGSSLRSDPIEVLLRDEIDAYPDELPGEGDPLDISERRTDNYAFPIIVDASTPAKPRGFSRIENAYLESDQRRFFVPCPFCAQMQTLDWRDADGVHRLVWQKDARGEVDADSVRYLCTHCGEGIPEGHKFSMLEAGEWRKTHPEVRSIAGFHITALYSPWKMNWADLAREWTKAQKNPEKLRSFLNLRLAETWDEDALTSFTAPQLRARAVEPFGALRWVGEKAEAHFERIPEEELTLPDGVCVLVAAADVQDNWIEAQTVGFGVEEEYWLLDHERFDGNPGSDASLWDQLDAFFMRSWLHPSGVTLAPAISLVDSGAHSDSVYDFVSLRQNAVRRVYACKGLDQLDRPGLIKEGTTKRGNIRLFLVGTVAAKDRLFARLHIPTAGPGYLHLPASATDDYLEQLTAEKKIIVQNKRYRTSRREYRKQPGTRNEALDLTVYSYAALAVLQQIIAPRIYRDLAAVKAVLEKGQAPETLMPARARRMRTVPIYDSIAL